MTDYISESAFEHRFWLQILGDHSRFMYLSFSTTETELIQTSAQFIEIFDRLLTEARADLDAAGWQGFARRVVPYVESLLNFKLGILNRHLDNKVKTSLPPTFFNHMINELKEYEKNLEFLAQGQVIPVVSPVHHHLIWVKDAELHAGTIYCQLDYTQTEFRNMAEKYAKLFLKHYGETIEYTSFLRTGRPIFPALVSFDSEVAGAITNFTEYLELIKTKIISSEVIGSILPLTPDHMAREECYYLHRLHKSDPAGVPLPQCDPARPRIQE